MGGMKVLIFDTETSGLIANHTIKLKSQPHIIEFAYEVVDLVTSDVSFSYDQLIKPPENLTDEIIKITSISNEDLIDQPAFKDVAATIKSALENAPLILGQNISFDREIVDIEFERLGQKIIWPECICSIESTVGMKGYRLSLTELHQLLFGQSFEGAHRANVDVAATRRCCVELYRIGYL